MGSLDATLGPRRFFLPIRVGGGGSHLGFCFYECQRSRLGELRLWHFCLFPGRLLEVLPCREGDRIAYYPVYIRSRSQFLRVECWDLP